jgi:hypothetical protein
MESRTFADGLLHYELSIVTWVKRLQCGPRCEKLYTPALYIFLKLLKMEARLITKVNYFENLYNNVAKYYQLLKTYNLLTLKKTKFKNGVV